MTLVSKKVGDPNEDEAISDEEGSEIFDEFGTEVGEVKPTSSSSNAKRIRKDRQQHGESLRLPVRLVLVKNVMAKEKRRKLVIFCCL